MRFAKRRSPVWCGLLSVYLGIAVAKHTYTDKKIKGVGDVMQILGRIEAKQKRFFVGGREVLRIDFELPTGQTPAAKHFFDVVRSLCACAEREQLPLATEALQDAVHAGQGHRFARRQYRVALTEKSAGKRRRVTVSVTLSFHDARRGEQVVYFRVLETLWDAEGVLQADKRKERRPWRFKAFFKGRKTGKASKEKQEN